MISRGKYPLTILAMLLLAVMLLLYMLPSITVIIVERELRALGFTDIVLDIQTITSGKSKITTLRAKHPAFSLRADEVTLHYTLTQLLNARIEQIEITSLQLTLHKHHDKAAGIALPVLPDFWLSVVPFNRAHIKHARLLLPEAVQGITHLDLQAMVTRNDTTLNTRATINSDGRPPVLLNMTVNDDNTLTITLNDKANATSILTLNNRELTVTHDNLNTIFALEVNIKALLSLSAAWLPEFSLPELFDTFSSEGTVEYNHANKRLRAELEVILAGSEQVLRGPVSLTYQPARFAFTLKKLFNIEARNLSIAQASLPQLGLSVKDDINCVLNLEQTSWQCGSAAMTLTLPELQYPPYTMRSAPGRITLHHIRGDRESWQIDTDLVLPTVKLALPDNVIRLDRVVTHIQGSSAQLKAKTSLYAANDKLSMDIIADHDLQQQRGKAEIKLQPVSFDESHNIPGKLLQRWPYPVHITAGELVGKSSITWQQQNGQFALDQVATVQLDKVNGRFLQYPFSGLRGKLHIKGIDTLHISSSDGIRLHSINPGLPVTNILVRAVATRQPGKALVTKLEHIEAAILGGKISTGKTVFDLNQDDNRLLMKVQELDISKLFRLEQKQGLRGTGKLSGKLPITIGIDGLTIAAGQLSALPPYGVIHYSADERVSALAKSNPNIELLVRALSDFRYDLLEARLDYNPQGKLLAKVRLQGKNPQLEGGRPVHLNINLEENIPELLRSLQYANEISRKIGEGIERGSPRH